MLMTANFVAKSKQFPCFRCGLCCAEYQPRLELVEARHIANKLGLALDDFLKRYTDKRWPGTDSVILRKSRGACIFLKHMTDRKQAICLIHPFRPSSCREWIPGVHQRECRDGLSRYWGLEIDTSGELVGSIGRVRRFKQLQESLMNEVEDADIASSLSKEL